MEKQELVFEQVTDFGFGGGKEYVPAPVGEPLEAYVSDIRKTEQINDKYKKLANGDENPTYGKSVPTLVVDFTLDESAAKGQRYSSWISYSYDAKNDRYFLALSDKSNMGKVSLALTGDVKGIEKIKPEEVIGSRLRISLRPSKNNAERLVPDLNKLFTTKMADKRVNLAQPEVVPASVPEDLDAAFDKALEEAK